MINDPKDATDEFSFLLKPSTVPGAGVGVFAVHSIKQGVQLDIMPTGPTRILPIEEVPPPFRVFCCARENGMLDCPQAFNKLDFVWFLNHSRTPNAEIRGTRDTENVFTLRAIEAGEEILIDYNTLKEPEVTKDWYY